MVVWDTVVSHDAGGFGYLVSRVGMGEERENQAVEIIQICRH